MCLGDRLFRRRVVDSPGFGLGGSVGLWAMAMALGVVTSGCRDQAGLNQGDEVVVFAAASTGDVIREVAARYEEGRSISVKPSLGATSTLAKQIVAGASADIFLSASSRWMDFVARKGRIQRGTRRDLLANEMVLIAPVGEDFSVTVSSDFAISEAFSGRFAIANPDHVPAGRYGRAVLRELGWWSELKRRALSALDVRMALRFVERGEAGAGIVYRTDAIASDRVTIAAEIPSRYQSEIRYPVALCRDASSGAAAFLKFLEGAWSKKRFEAAGFHVIRDPVSVTDGGDRP